MRIVATLGLTLAVLVAVGSPARADGDIGVIVLGEETMGPQLAAQIGDWLARHGHTLVPNPLPSEVIPSLTDCYLLDDPRGCVRLIIEQRARTATMVYARVQSRNNTTTGTRDVTLTAYWFDKGHDAVTETRTCEHCTDQALRTAADEVMKRLASSILGAAGHIKLTSRPSGARISIDGQPIGVTPLDWDLPPGKHTIQMDKPGREAEIREVVIVSNRNEAIAMDLSTYGETAPSRILPAALMVVGGGLIITGGVFIAINQESAPELPRRIRDTKLEGIGFAAGGAVVAGLGAWLWWSRSPTASSAPVAAFTSDTAYIGWQGRF